MMKYTYTLGLCLLFSAVLTAQKAPDFTITDYNGKVHKLYEDYLDQGKVVMIKIMFVICPPCNSIAPSVQALYEDFGEGREDVEFFELSNKSWDTNSAVKGFGEKHGLTFPGAGVDGGALAAVDPYVAGTFGRFLGTPTFIVIDKDGNVDFAVNFSNLKSAIEDALDDTGGCSNAFSGEVDTTAGAIAVSLKSDVPGSMVYQLNPDSASAYGYNCEFTFPPQALQYYVEVEKDGEDLLGLSTKDIVFTVRHLLGLQPFTKSEEKLAADFNANNVVSAQDISEMRKLILGVKPENTFHNSWRFWNTDTDFSHDTTGVLIPPLIERVALMDLVDANVSGNFEGVKLGDVSGDINQFFGEPNRTRSKQEFFFDDAYVSKGQLVEVDIISKEALTISAIQGGILLSGSAHTFMGHLDLDFHVRDTREGISLIGYTPYDVHVNKGDKLYSVSFIAENSGWVSDLISKATGVTRSLVMYGDDSEAEYDLKPMPHKRGISLSPNPTSGHLNVYCGSDIQEISVLTTSGLMANPFVSVKGKNAMIDMSSLNNGLYFLQIKCDHKMDIHRVVKH
jgi:peroxiredoxin